MTLEEKIQRCLDVEEIKQLKARYFRCIDRKLWSEWPSIFAEDVVTCGQGFEIRGCQPIMEFTRERLEGATTVHHGHTLELWFDDERNAHGIWAMQDIVQFDGSGAREGFWGYGHYEDRYIRLDEGWRIARCELVRHLTHKMAGGYPQHWLEKQPGVYASSS
jgi:hypothetical protein